MSQDSNPGHICRATRQVKHLGKVLATSSGNICRGSCSLKAATKTSLMSNGGFSLQTPFKKALKDERQNGFYATTKNGPLYF